MNAKLELISFNLAPVPPESILSLNGDKVTLQEYW